MQGGAGRKAQTHNNAPLGAGPESNGRVGNAGGLLELFVLSICNCQYAIIVIPLISSQSYISSNDFKSFQTISNHIKSS